MDVNGSTGNPSAALSHQLPARPDDKIQSADCISASEEDDWQNRESVSLPGSQKDQSPAEIRQSPVETHQSPAEKRLSPADELQSPAEERLNPAQERQSPAEEPQSPAEERLNPAEERQSPAEEPQSPAEERLNPAEEPQSPAEERLCPAETQLNPAKTHHSPAETQWTANKHLRPAETHQSPSEKHQKPAETHQRSAESNESLIETQQSAKKHQRPAEIQRTAENPDQLGLTKHIKYKDPLTEIQETEDSPTKPDPLQPNLPTQQQKWDDSPPMETQKTKDSPPKDQPEIGQPSPTQPGPLKPDPLCSNQKKSGDLFCPEGEHQIQQGFTNQKTEEDSPPVKDLTVFTSTFEKQIQAIEFHFSESRDQQNHQDLPPEKLIPTTPERHQDHQDPPPHFNTKQDAPPPPHLNTKQDPPHLNTKQDPPPSHLNTKQDPPHLNTKQDPPHLNTKQDPPPPHMNTKQDPPPPHLNIEQVSPPEILPLIIHPTEVLTPPGHVPPDEAPLVQAPPVEAPLIQTPPAQPPPVQAPPVQAPPPTIKVFSDQMRPPSLVSSSADPKLCGFLQKQGGPLRAWKQRWFTYEEKKNQLFYYRTPQDVTPLGRVELWSATFTYPLKAEKGTFHIKTPERTFILKAVSQELMLYWLQQLQLKRWQHRQMSTCRGPTNINNNNNNSTDDFLPVLKSPLGLVGEEAAYVSSQWAPLANVSIKHPLIQIQNSVHSLRKRTSVDGSQSVFHLEAPPWIPPGSADIGSNTAPSTPTEPPTPPALLSMADPAGQVTLAEVREVDGNNRKTKRRSSSPMTILRRDPTSSLQTSRLQQEKQMLMEEVKAQKELVWILHKALEASQLEKRTCAEFLAEKGEQERLELLRHRERQVADLRGQLENAMMEVKATRTSLAQSDAQLVQLQDYIGMLVERNNAKQEVIIKLSDQVTTCMSSADSLESPTLRRLRQEVENLKDDIEAYKTQNRFLNSELYQLTNLWRTSSEQEKSLMVKCAYLEATNCQVESRYLGVLRQLQETKSLDPVQRGAVQKMIEDALKGEIKSIVKLNMARDHDEYGFKIIPDYEVEDMKLLAKIQALEIRSHNLLHQEGGEHPLLSRWSQYLAGRSDDDICASPELKGLLRGGVPQEYRQRMWRWVVRARTLTIRDRHPQRYQQLCEKSRTCSHPASRQIQLDLHRTLTTNQHFSSPSSPALQQLRRILLAFSWQNPVIGYCQGLNRLAAISLLVLQSEEDAFWCLVAVVEAIMPQDYYTKNLVASQADQRVLKDFLAEKLPRLAAHFEDHSIDVSLITFNWFLVVFVESLPSDILLPLWDAFLYEGTKVIFRYTLALFKYKEDDILKIHDSVEIYQYLRFFTKTISDGRRLTSIAFGDMNPFPGRLLRNRRALHLERLQGELREVEEQQREFVSESAVRKDKELDTMVSEDDEEL